MGTVTPVPRFVRVAEGDYETADGRFRLTRVRGVTPPAWNVEENVGDGPGSFDTPWKLRVDGAATKRDALALFADWRRAVS